ncbi:phage tail spike protein [Enterococcus malodoratus]|uniref:phage tail spike protein n=1 Tax=Enterococcus malodoratus TaxID=71451 RepID=UPI002073D054|nr:phage tail spike protein [Enterococcus malodoratus]
MSTIILHDKKNNNWSSLGIGPLSDALNPLVSRERNGMYELTFKYPVKAPLFKELKVGRWVVADAGPSIQSQSQQFEIAEITKPINGVVTVYCEHYRYQLLRSIVKVGSAFSNIPAQTALNQLRDRMEPKGDFTFYSDILTRSSIDFTDPSRFGSAQEALGGTRGSVLDNFGGEYVFNNNQVRLMSQAGTEKNVIIAYGKNLTDINQEESIENTYTSVYGWAKVGNGNDEKIITLPETYIDSEYVGNYTQRRIQMVDFSDKEPKDVATLRTLIQAYIKNNKVGIPKVSIKTKYVDLASSVMDEQLKTLETIDLCDWVTVVFNELDINTSAQIVKTLWNVTLDKYESVELGEARTDFAKVLDDSQPDVDKINDKVDWLEKAQQEASDIIKNPGKGHVVIYPSLADPQEMLIMDTTDINTAKNVWRWNAGGLGFSSTGYNGTYGLAMTNNGAIVADLMTTGTLRAINIVGVAISGSTLEGNNIFMNLESGDFQTTQAANGGITTAKYSNGKITFSDNRAPTGEKYKANITAWGVMEGETGKAYPALQLRAYNFARLYITESPTELRIRNNSNSTGFIDLIAQETYVSGNFNVQGTKNAIHATRDGIRETPAYETTESYLGDIGIAETDDHCTTTILIDELFSDVVNTDYEYQVFLQSYSDGYVYVEERAKDSFVVRSSAPHIPFAWEIKAKRRGYEKERLTLNRISFEEFKELCEKEGFDEQQNLEP